MADPQTNKMLAALDVNDLESADQEAILLEIGDLAFKSSMLNLIDRMDDQTKEDFTKLLETDPTEDSLNAFLKNRVPDADAAVTEALQGFANDILAVQDSNS